MSIKTTAKIGVLSGTIRVRRFKLQGPFSYRVEDTVQNASVAGRTAFMKITLNDRTLGCVTRLRLGMNANAVFPTFEIDVVDVPETQDTVKFLEELEKVKFEPTPK